MDDATFVTATGSRVRQEREIFALVSMEIARRPETFVWACRRWDSSPRPLAQQSIRSGFSIDMGKHMSMRSNANIYEIETNLLADVAVSYSSYIYTYKNMILDQARHEFIAPAASEETYGSEMTMAYLQRAEPLADVFQEASESVITD